MSPFKTRIFVRMRRVIGIGLMVLAGTAPTRAQPGASPLARAVRPALTDAPLAGLLATLSRQSGVPFSYSSTRIGGQRRCHLRPGPPQPLGVVLREVAGQFRLSYGLLNGQLVLWPASEPAPPGIAELNGQGQPAASRSVSAVSPVVPNPTGLAAAETRVSAIGLASATGLAGHSAGRVGGHGTPIMERGPEGPERVIAPASRLKARVGGVAVWPGRPSAATPAGRRATSRAATAGPATAARFVARHSTSGSPDTAGELALATTHSRAGNVPGAARPETGVSALPPRVVALTDTRAAADRPMLLPAGPTPVPVRRPPLLVRRQQAQVSLLPPLSSNWTANARTVNRYSLNVLAGYSSGVSRLEVGGLLNVVRDSVHGLQAAGLANLTGTDTRGVQLAGLANVNGGAVRGIQGAGFVNVARDDVRGLQIAGLANVAGGAARARHRPDQPTRLRRWLGLPRLLATDPLSQLPVAPSVGQRGLLVQAAALTNLTGTDVRGLQTAALLNVAHRVSGAQFGLVNVARHVHGVQFGLVNIADSVDGAALGVVNIVRHGYLHGEVWASESLPLNAVLKLGVRRYYTLLGVAAEPFGSRVQWAAGVGIGTAGRPHGRFTFSLDALHWTLAGTSDNANNATVDNRLLTQLRPAVAWQIERQGHLQLVVSPTLNLAIAWSNDHQPQWDFGANQLLLLNTAGDQSRTRLWPGLQIGLRF